MVGLITQVVHVLQKGGQAKGWFCLEGMPYGRTGNQLLTIGYSLWNAKFLGLAGLQVLPSCMGDGSFMEWSKQIEVGPDFVIGEGGTCVETKTWEAMYYEQLNTRGDRRFVPPKPTALIRSEAEKAAIKFSVHGRSFEGICGRSEHICPNKLARSMYDMCDYSWNKVSTLLPFEIMKEFNTPTLFTDRQNGAMDATYGAAIDEHPFLVQLWMMVLSDAHVGNPQSSIDYLVWLWKQADAPPGWRMYPVDCYTFNGV